MYADVSTVIVIALLLCLAAGVLQVLSWVIKILIPSSRTPTLPDEDEPFAVGLRPSELQELGKQRFQLLLEKELARGGIAEPRAATRAVRPPSAADS